jgi:hypothetical protein
MNIVSILEYFLEKEPLQEKKKPLPKVAISIKRISFIFFQLFLSTFGGASNFFSRKKERHPLPEKQK